MTNAITQSSDGMIKIKLILTIAILSAVLSGCIEPTEPVGTPTPLLTPTPTIEPTSVPTYIPTPTPTPTRNATFYRSEVDDTYGFYRIIAVNSTKPVLYNNNTLTIYAGDNIRWISDSDYEVTIVSAQGLWDNVTGKLRWRYKEINYTFNQPGEYDVYIRESPRSRMKIIVNP